DGSAGSGRRRDRASVSALAALDTDATRPAFASPPLRLPLRSAALRARAEHPNRGLPDDPVRAGEADRDTGGFALRDFYRERAGGKPVLITGFGGAGSQRGVVCLGGFQFSERLCFWKRPKRSLLLPGLRRGNRTRTRRRAAGESGLASDHWEAG